MLLALGAATALSSTPPTPVWPSAFSVSFNESTLSPLPHHTTGYYYYDAAHGRARTDRANGAGDRYCGTVVSQATACQHIVVNSTRYLVFPQIQKCCECCTAAKGCGIVAPDWIVQSNATYQGQAKNKHGVLCDKWLVKGLQNNYYYQTVNGGVIAELVQEPNDDQIFEPSTYRVAAQPDSLFELPSYCSGKCGGVVCTLA